MSDTICKHGRESRGCRDCIMEKDYDRINILGWPPTTAPLSDIERIAQLEADLREANIRADYYLDKLNAIVDCREVGGDTPERQVEFCVSVAESATNAFPPKEGEDYE